MYTKIKAAVTILVTTLGLIMPAGSAYAANISLTATCNVQVYIKGTVPDSVEQGKTFSLSNFTVQPANTYGFNVTSSIYYLTATNTSSTTYTQDFYATNPSPTTGHNTYVGYYPNWTLDAKGAVGSAVTITLIKSYTVIQGYGGSPVTCNFSKTLATIPITASAAPAPSTQPSSGSSTPASSQPASQSTSSGTSGSKVGVAATVTGSPTPSPTTSSSAPAQPGNLTQNNPETNNSDSGEQSVSVVPLNLEVKDSSGKAVTGAQVTLDNGKTLITDADGRVVFSNVLTGTHAVLVSYKGLKLNKSIALSADDVGNVKSISLPAAPSSFNPVVIGAIAAGTLGIGAAAGYFLLVRRRRAAEEAAAHQPAMTIHGIIDGSAVPKPVSGTIEHIPAIPAFDSQPSMAGPVQNPAPWDPASLAMPVLASEAPVDTTAAPAQPQQLIQHFSTPDAPVVETTVSSDTSVNTSLPEPVAAQPDSTNDIALPPQNTTPAPQA